MTSPTTKPRVLSYADRTRFEDDEVTAKMVALGIPTTDPDDDFFEEAAIVKAMDNLSDDSKFQDGATLAAQDYSPAQIIAFAKLAEAMGGLVSVTNYYGLKVRSLKPEEDRRQSALRNLRYQLKQDRQDDAIRVLLEEAEAGTL